MATATLPWAAMALDRKLTDLFMIFQDKEKNVVDVKDLPTVLRALGNDQLKVTSQVRCELIILKTHVWIG